MPRLGHFLHRLRALFRRDALEREMNAELQAHVEELIARNRAAGMPPAEARAAARRAFGGVAQIQERARDARRFAGLEHLQRDVRHAVRLLVKTPLFSGVIVLSLALGIGVNTAIYSWIDTVLFRPIAGVPGAASFQLLETRTEANAFPGWSWLDYRDVRERLPAFRDLLAFRMVPLNVGEPGRDERVYAQLVSENYFPALELQPALGRFFTSEGATAPEAPVVISYGFWQAHFAGAADVVGRTLRANDRLLTVVAVAPREFRGTVLALNFDLWVPAALAPVLFDGSRELEARGFRGYSVMGRLQPDADRAQAQRDLDGAMRHFAVLYPETNAGLTAEARPFSRPSRGPQRMLIGGLFILQGLTLLVLVVVCANTANLLLARATARRREIGVRLALGAGPRRIAAMLLSESLVLAGAGAALGILLALWGTEALRAIPAYGALPLRFETSLHGGALAFAVALALGCGVIFGLAPALQLARTDPQDAFRAAARSGGRSRLRSALVGIEAGVAVLVLAIAAFFLKNFADARVTETGYARERVLLAAYDLNGRGYDTARARAVTNTLLEKLRTLPGVEAAAIGSMVPLDIHGLPSRAFTLEGRVRTKPGADEALSYNVTPDYLRVVGVPLREGRDFAPLDDTSAPPQAIVNAEFVRRYLRGEPALGRHITIGERRFEIVGVTRNALYEAFGEPPKPIIYLSYRDRFALSGQIHVRTRGPESALAPELRQIVRAIDPAIQVYDVRTFAEHVDRNLLFRRVPARIFGVLGPLILFLAAIGIYAVVAYAVAQRTVEIGVRRALGATEGAVTREIIFDGMRSVLAGTVAGTLLAFLVNAHLRGISVGPAILLGAPLLLILVAALACWLPARRAARVDPMVALRHE